jgi:CHAD domain-containing protein
MAPSNRPAKRSASKSRPGRLHGAMTCEAAFRGISSGCLGDVAACHQATCAGVPAALHQMRIALTRLRTAIAFFSPMVADQEWTRLKSELKWLNGYLGATRDLDVAIESLQRVGAGSVRAFRTARSESQRRLKRALASDRYRRWFKAMTALVEDGPWSAENDPRSARWHAIPISGYHAHKLARWHDKLASKSHGLQGMGRRKLHRLRLTSKRLRYAIEFSEGALPEADFARWRSVVKQLRKGQGILGEFNDARIRWSLIADLERSTGKSTTPDREQLKQLDRKKAARLLRRAAIVYRKIAR